MTELIWNGKYDENGELKTVDRTILPFQVVETVNESKADREKAQRDLFTKQAHDPEWQNIEIVAQASPPAYSSRDKGKNAGETPALQKAALLSGWHGRGYLPHLKAEGGTYFVTFRLADTLPQQVLEPYRFEREDIVKRAQAMGRELTRAEEKRLAQLHSDRIESYLDAGHGKCWLREPGIARSVADALRHFDGERYDLHAWVVMPNHVHAVLSPRQGHTLSSIVHNWKSFTAHEAREVAQASRLQIPKGDAFWQRESYDHLVRDEADFARVCRYTVENPVKAGLCDKPEDWPYVGVAQASPRASSRRGVAQASPPAYSSRRKAGSAGEDACATSDFTKRCPND